MRKTVEVRHRIWIGAAPATVRAQFADLHHHIDANVHPNLRFEVLAQEPQRARFTQEVKLLGMRQRDLFERVIDDDGSIHDRSIQGFNEGGTLDIAFRPADDGDRSGTEVDITIRIPAPPFLGWLAPVLEKQIRKEVTVAAEQDKRDIESGYPRGAAVH
jgi:hypothetical protein